VSRFLLTKRATFEASHLLPHHDGKCRRLHGHSWKVEVEVECLGLHLSGPKSGMGADFGDISDPLKALVEARLDHYHLNDSTGLEDPTSERLCVWIFDRLAPEYERLGVTLSAVTIEETCTSRARFEP
jgi:6-pyruvoyltetrahydropterin/6-carboxytetrahydropterin synthase